MTVVIIHVAAYEHAHFEGFVVGAPPTAMGALVRLLSVWETRGKAGISSGIA
jgi:hypothetical protein